ncbi:MAG: hypothetical protein Q9170_005062 [Blastenia crenularia]
MASLKASLPTFLHTERLVMELFDYSDAHYNCLLSAMNSPVAHRNMGDYGIRTPAAFDDLNRGTRLSSSTIGGRVSDTDIYYLLRPGEKSAPLIGGVSMVQRAKSVPPDVGWCILEDFMGHGYAAEAGKELLRMAKECLGVREVITWPGAKNQRSLRVAEKIGFVFGGEVADKDGGLNAVYVLPVYPTSPAEPRLVGQVEVELAPHGPANVPRRSLERPCIIDTSLTNDVSHACSRIPYLSIPRLEFLRTCISKAFSIGSDVET